MVKYSVKKTSTKRSSLTRRRNRVRKVMRVPRPLKTNYLSIKRSWYAGRVVPSTVSTNNFWCYCTPTLMNAGILSTTTLSGLPNLSEYTVLFDAYKISGIKYRFVPRNMDYNLGQINPTGTFYDVPMVSIINDPTSVVLPSGAYTMATYNTFAETGSLRRIRGDKEFTIYMKPLIQEQYGSGALRYIKPRFTATDSNGQTMPHRGFHIFWHNFNFSSTFTEYDVYVTYYITFKGQR